jgi:hypothetical protein
MDAIVILEREHAKAKNAMEAVAKSPLGLKKGLFDALKAELELHDNIEEHIFYPAVLAHPKTSGLPQLDKKAHLLVEEALDALEALPVADPKWDPAFKAMQERLLSHVADEEANYFVVIRGALSPAELMDLGDKMNVEKEKHLKTA